MLNHTLNCKVVLYVPSTVGTLKNQNRVQEEWIEKILEQFSDWFGGATAQKAEGAWKSESQGLVREPVVLVYAFCDLKTLSAQEFAVRTLAQKLAQDMKQECVSLEIGGCLYFEYPLAKAA